MSVRASIYEWLFTHGRETSTVAELLRGLSRRLREEGLPIDRALFGSMVLHPQTAAVLCLWESDDDQIHEKQFPPLFFAGEESKNTPLFTVQHSGKPMRVELGGRSSHPMEVMQDLIDSGFSDYVLFPVEHGGEFQGGLSFATKDESGFSDEGVAQLESLVPAIATAMDRLLAEFVSEQLLCAYLGRDAGSRVTSGQIRLGDQQTIEAAIWFSDLRGFTAMSERLSPPEVIKTINEAFDVVVNSIHAHEGQVLKFMGDGLLGMFLADQGARACANAVAAARATQQGLIKLRAEQKRAGRVETEVGVGLHFGDVTYGNIGAESRLDFTVIGRAVNLASRIEGLCSKLDRNVLASDVVSDLLGGQGLELVGAFAVKGVETPVDIFGLVPS